MDHPEDGSEYKTQHMTSVYSYICMGEGKRPVWSEHGNAGEGGGGLKEKMFVVPAMKGRTGMS